MKCDLYKDTRDDSLYVVTTETWAEFRLNLILNLLAYAFFLLTTLLWFFGIITISLAKFY